MVLDQALRADRRFAGVVGISGFLRMVEEFPAAFGAAGLQQDILLTHGLYDGLLPIANTRRIKDRLLKLGARIDWREYPKEHTLDPLSELPDIAEWLERRMGQAGGGAGAAAP
jgi:phospholipase/carboxylesterase